MSNPYCHAMDFKNTIQANPPTPNAGGCIYCTILEAFRTKYGKSQGDKVFMQTMGLDVAGVHSPLSFARWWDKYSDLSKRIEVLKSLNFTDTQIINHRSRPWRLIPANIQREIARGLINRWEKLDGCERK